MNETQGARRAWTPEEKAALLAAVEQCRATGGQLEWHAIAATIPGRGAQSAGRFISCCSPPCACPTSPMPRSVA
jgi:hypothetical protein